MELNELLEKWREHFKVPKRPSDYTSSLIPRGVKITAADLEERLKKDPYYQSWLEEKEELQLQFRPAYISYPDNPKTIGDHIRKKGWFEIITKRCCQNFHCKRR